MCLGANWGAPIENYSDASWDKVMNLNVKGVFYLTVALLPLLKAAATTVLPIPSRFVPPQLFICPILGGPIAGDQCGQRERH